MINWIVGSSQFLHFVQVRLLGTNFAAYNIVQVALFGGSSPALTYSNKLLLRFDRGSVPLRPPSNSSIGSGFSVETSDIASSIAPCPSPQSVFSSSRSTKKVRKNFKETRSIILIYRFK